MSHVRDLVDRDDPRAPTVEAWEALTPEERADVVRLLPAEVPWELAPPEGDPHRKASALAIDALDNYFRRIGRRVYLSSNLAVYYPGEARFAPDLVAVLDVEPHDREKWVVAHEGKALDLVLEVLVAGSEAKDLRLNVERYARLGIPEYFVLDIPRSRLVGFRLVGAGQPYQPVLPQGGAWHSEVLGLDLALEGKRVRFYTGSAMLPETAELMERANRLLEEQIELREEQARVAEEQARVAEEQARVAEEQARRAEALERRLEEALAELERLKRRE